MRTDLSEEPVQGPGQPVAGAHRDGPQVVAGQATIGQQLVGGQEAGGRGALHQRHRVVAADAVAGQHDPRVRACRRSAGPPRARCRPAGSRRCTSHSSATHRGAGELGVDPVQLGPQPVPASCALVRLAGSAYACSSTTEPPCSLRPAPGARPRTAPAPRCCPAGRTRWCPGTAAGRHRPAGPATAARPRTAVRCAIAATRSRQRVVADRRCPSSSVARGRRIGRPAPRRRPRSRRPSRRCTRTAIAGRVDRRHPLARCARRRPSPLEVAAQRRPERGVVVVAAARRRAAPRTSPGSRLWNIATSSPAENSRRVGEEAAGEHLQREVPGPVREAQPVQELPPRSPRRRRRRWPGSRRRAAPSPPARPPRQDHEGVNDGLWATKAARFSGGVRGIRAKESACPPASTSG